MEYVTALEKELVLELEKREVVPRTIYFGGGTPSLLSIEAWLKVEDFLKEHLDLSKLEEFDIEANPKTFDLEKAQVLKSIGVSRVSLGVQSWIPEELELLGRDHSPDEAEAAFDILKEAEIEHLSMDLMFSIPKQTKVSWLKSLEKTISLEPDHISAYNLTYEEDTDFLEKLKSGEYSECDDLNAELYVTAESILEKNGYEHYEISNYGKSGHRSVHNEAYWSGKDYLGLGAGATSTVNRTRWSNIKNTSLYVDSLKKKSTLPFRETEQLDDDALLLEKLALGLRRSEGVSLKDLGSVTRLDEKMAVLETNGYIIATADRLVLSNEGRMLVDPIVLELLD